MLPEISFDLPPLEGNNIREHFHAVGAHTAEPYRSMAKEFADADLPPVPEKWSVDRPGWVRYGLDGSVTPVDNLSGETLVCFDVETLYKLSPYPVMAAAASPNAWYSWLSPNIFEEAPTEEAEPRPQWDKTLNEHHARTLVPLFGDSKLPSIAIGHNVGYDRQRVAEEYSLDRTPTRWLDTLSLHVATRGITSVQRPTWIKHRNNKRDKIKNDLDTMDMLQQEAASSGDALLSESLREWKANINESDPQVEVQTWEETTSVNSLADVAKLHCGIEVDKSIRDTFGDEKVKHASQLRPDLQDLLKYCANDVKVTHDVYKVVFPLYLTSCPHPASFAGVLSMGNSFLPVDHSWGKYLEAAESMYQDLREDVRVALRTLADRLKREGQNDQDPWTRQLDWSPKNARWPDGFGEDPAGASTEAAESTLEPVPSASTVPTLPQWYEPIAAKRDTVLEAKFQRDIVPLLLKISCHGYPVYQIKGHGWCFSVPWDTMPDFIDLHGAPIELGPGEIALEPLAEQFAFFRCSLMGASKRTKLTGATIAKDVKKGVLTSPYPELLQKLTKGIKDVEDELVALAEETRKAGSQDSWSAQLDWTTSTGDAKKSTAASRKKEAVHGTWPKWFWDLTASPTSKKQKFGELDLTMRKTLAPLLLRMKWQGYPLAYSKEHKWIYRVPKEEVSKDTNSSLAEVKAVHFKPVAGDERIAEDTEYAYFRLPHKDGEGNNVGNPLSKAFLKPMESGELSSALADDPDQQLAGAAKTATNMNALCSYWISARERIMGQFVVFKDGAEQGMILPQVITMGTVTRRAVEATWLTASNAKKNRVGSELKSMVRAPKGYSIVGADVDSEELWISSVMGDSQFGLHGATAIGWMTLEGTKSAGTDLHSKTASILSISRDAAKVFNYSRIYGAGKPHAIQLLLQGDGNLTTEAADQLSTNLYKRTKGHKTFRSKNKGVAAAGYIWHGGSESYLFNTLESIALMDRPTTPALGCGVTRALRKSFLDAGHSYLPSRINWVVQSSGVDYLHLLISAMEYLTAKYDIKARYLISVHDEVRYLAVEEDKYRCALALQVANAWTRALFCYNLGLDDMPQGIAFFSAVDVDHVLRKETDMTCVTPSHPTALSPGESLDIDQVLKITGGSLGTDVLPNPLPRVADPGPPVRIFDDLASPAHKRYLVAQAGTSARNAKMWLDSQPPLPDQPPPKAKKATKPRTPKATVQTADISDISESTKVSFTPPDIPLDLLAALKEDAEYAHLTDDEGLGHSRSWDKDWTPPKDMYFHPQMMSHK